MSLEFLHPEALWLLAGLAALALLLRWAARAPARHHQPAPLRAAAAALIVVALAEPMAVLRTGSMSVAYLVDVSRSMSSESLADALKWIGEAQVRGTPARAHFIAFGSGVQAFDTLEALQEVRVGTQEVEASGRGIDDGGTDLEYALDAAHALLGQERVRRIVAFTDGNQTRGDALRSVSRLRAQGIPVFVVPGTVTAEPRAWIDDLWLRSPVHAGAPAVLSLRALARTEGQAEVEVWVEGTRRARQSVRLRPGANEWTRQVRFSGAGSKLLEVRLSMPGQSGAQAEAARMLVAVKPAVRVLYLERAREDARFLAAALRAQGMDVTVATPPRVLDAGPLERYDVVILSDLPVSSVERSLGARLQRFVRAGGGLVFAGGDSAYGQDGFTDTRIESILPVRFRERRKREQLDLLLLIDRSSSMQGAKLESAKAAAMQLLDVIGPEHRLGVIAFSARPREVAALQRLSDRQAVAQSIAAMSAGGQTDIFSALWHARGLLRGSQAAVKHVILLSDGDTVPVATLRPDPSQPAARGDAPPEDFRALSALLAREGVSVSTIAVGEAPQIEFMRNIADWTGGASHVARNEAEIPGLIVADARGLASDSIVERPFRAALRWRPATLDGVDFDTAPPLLGLVVAQPKRHAEVLLEGIGARPLLVRSHYGLGRSIAFLSDVKQRWAVQWLSWPGYGRFWAQLVRSAARDDPAPASWRIVRERDGARLVLTALTAAGRHANGLRLQARVTGPEGPARAVTLDQTGPGRYEAFLAHEISRAGLYRFDLVDPGATSESGPRLPGPLSLRVPRDQEMRFLAPDLALLQALADGTGGVLSPTHADAFSDRGARGLLRVHLWPGLAAAALACVLLELLLLRRRMPPTPAAQPPRRPG